MSTTGLFWMNLVVTVAFGGLMLRECLRQPNPAWSIRGRLVHKPVWRSLVEPEAVLALSAATIALTVVCLV
ncbi:MAG: hypothetical protein HZA90_21775 [Verrucomicrobia bacterium]|nr:hypothetical protein [Verrucomicrobiota bacterium]